MAAACGGSERSSEQTALRVGTSGDLPPYSEAIAGTYAGIDIDLAMDLGRSMGRQVEFVRFSWLTLLSDAVEQRFDVAMSGIYITPSREAGAHFSHPYLTVGQTAVVRCQDVARFERFEDIDRIGVRILTHPGASPQSFVHENLTNATFVEVGDAKDVFRHLAGGEGDVTFGNVLRAKYAAEHDGRLCLGLGGATFGSHRIAVLMAKDSPYRPPVNDWLGTRLRDGFITSVINAHVDP